MKKMLYHWKKLKPEKIDIESLVKETDGFSGADIEGVVKDRVETAFAEDRDHLETRDIKKAIRETNSLMELMGASLEKLTQEYEKRKYKNASVK